VYLQEDNVPMLEAAERMKTEDKTRCAT